MNRTRPALAGTSNSAPHLLTLLFLALLVAGTARNVRFVRAHAESVAVYNLGVDAGTYEEAAQRFARRPRARLLDASQPPGFIAMLGLLHRTLGTDRLPIKLVFCGLVAATALLTWRIGLAWDPLAGAVAGALVAWSPMLQAYAATLQYEVPAAFLCTICISVLLRLCRSRSATWLPAATAAAVCALSALTREVLLVLFPVLLAALLMKPGDALRRRGAHAALALIVYTAIVGGWVTYQSNQSGRFVPISDKGAVNLAIGNNPNANGTYNLLASRVVQPAGAAFMVSHPARTLVLFGRKALYFAGILKDGWNVPRPAALYASRATWNVLPLDGWLLLFRGGAVFVLALIGAVLLVRDPLLRQAWWPVPVALVLVASVHVLTLSSHRFAVPVWPLAALLASIPVTRAWRAAPLPWPAALTAGIAVCVLAVLGQSWAPPGRYQRAASELDGDRVENVVDGASRYGRVRQGSVDGGRRMVAIETTEFIGRGFLAVTFGLRPVVAPEAPVPESDAVIADLVVSDEAGHIVCASGLTWADATRDRYTPFTAGCRIPDDTVLSVALWTRAVVAVRVDAFSLSFGHARPEDVTPVPRVSSVHRTATGPGA